MNIFPVKICGITRTQDAELAVELGALAIGFIFYRNSPRYIAPETAQHITENIGSCAAKVGVFVDDSINEVNTIAEAVGLDYVQLHGDESPAYCKEIIRPVIKAFRVTKKLTEEEILKYDAGAILFDAFVKGAPGGTGQTFRWEILQRFALEAPIILAGGLTSANVKAAIESVHPSAIDVSSGVEKSPGIKDREKMEQLFSTVKEVKEVTKNAIF